MQNTHLLLTSLETKTLEVPRVKTNKEMEVAVTAFRIAEALLRPQGPFFTYSQIEQEIKHLFIKK